MAAIQTAAIPPLSWTLSDPEQRLSFRGGRFTRVNGYCALLIAAVATTAFYGMISLVSESYFATMFTDRGPVPYVIAVFFFWSLAILTLKWLKLRLQRRALKHIVVPDDPSFVLSPKTVDDVNAKVYSTVDDPKHFVLFNRIVIALSNLQNLGRVTDVDEILRSQASHDESALETSYAMVQGFVWAIPVLGFIGTVQGLSGAIGGFGRVLASTTEIEQIKGSLQSVTGGLSIAFETTLEGLVAALFVQLILVALKQAEEEFLDNCSEYCVRHVVGRLRLMPYEETGA